MPWGPMDCNRAAESTVAFNRKRKRHDAIDPCLGFYPSSLAQVAQAETIFQPLLDPQAPSIPDLYTVLIQQRIPEVPELPRIEAYAASPESLDAMLSKPGPAATPAGKKLRTYAKQRRKRVPDDNGDTSSEQETSLQKRPISLLASTEDEDGHLKIVYSKPLSCPAWIQPIALSNLIQMCLPQLENLFSLEYPISFATLLNLD
ncbi:hypothetical protein F5890DRAFT_1489189 [Lentinula detonsa]|uniref:Uncharacterized protein n=1 Tax=Lentinula detonsa TaxID=2804962 RepID=A0AA38Q7B6_9AGAR|nr:hypothetical protein F5890DRAFT_1489189 [Lentinula detonsa]